MRIGTSVLLTSFSFIGIVLMILTYLIDSKVDGIACSKKLILATRLLLILGTCLLTLGFARLACVSSLIGCSDTIGINVGTNVGTIEDYGSLYTFIIIVIGLGIISAGSVIINQASSGDKKCKDVKQLGIYVVMVGILIELFCIPLFRTNVYRKK